ncbi:MAG: response regulator transcription factor [Lachnospiraceae bacterium]|nr:response regulator transcription factor [Lachnospiraceae bacterium]
MKKTVLIIEDEIEQLNVLKQLVQAAEENAEVYTASDVTHAYEILMEKSIDVFLVDIILDTTRPGDTAGVRLVERIRKIPKYMFTPVIFVTSLEDPTMYAYTDLNCMGYIEKPFEPDRIIKLVEKALNYTTAREKEISITFRKDGILYPVRLKEIVYMESQNHVIHVHLRDGSELEIPYKTCKQILQETDEGSLLQCSRSTIVNREYVQGVDVPNRYLMLKEGFGMLDIGGRYKKKILVELCDGCN